MVHMTYPEALVVGFIQGITELFPVSSLGHNVLIPALVGGSWAADLNVSAQQSPYLAFIVGLHVATAIGIMIYFWRDWVRIIVGFLTSIRDRDIRTTDQKLAWMVILATIPVGLAGVLFEHEFRVLFGVPVRAAIFLIINGLILFAGERFRTRRSRQADLELEQQRVAAVLNQEPAPPERERVSSAAGNPATATPGVAGSAAGAGPPAGPTGHQAARQDEIDRAIAADERLTRRTYLDAVLIGAAQILALLAGVSRDGVTMVAGMFGGLSREDAARFAFLLATPVILAAGVLKVPDLIQYGHGIYGQIVVGSILSGVGAYVSVRFLVRYFQTRTLTPFAIYCVVFGLASVLYLQLK
ncbi:MAG: undecaprenyl-diphosphate phosphatase [Streptosporangiaceae bacterium]